MYLKIYPNWPYVFNFKNIYNKPTSFQVYVNGKYYKEIKNLSPGKKAQIVVGSKIINPANGKSFKREDIINVSFQLLQDAKLEYSSPNVIRKFVFSSSKPFQGANIPDNKILEKQGFYTLSFN